MLIDQIHEELKQAQLAKDEVKVSTLRLLLSEIKYSVIAKSEDRSEIEDELVLQVVQKEVKKRRESIASYQQANRTDLVEKEQAELKILEQYLPAQMGDAELTKIVEEAMTQTGATTMADMGKVMGIVVSKTKGQADGGRISVLVKERLAK